MNTHMYISQQPQTRQTSHERRKAPQKLPDGDSLIIQCQRKTTQPKIHRNSSKYRTQLLPGAISYHAIVIRTHDGPKIHVSPYVDTPYLVLIIVSHLIALLIACHRLGRLHLGTQKRSCLTFRPPYFCSVSSMKGIDMNIRRNVMADDPGSSKSGRPAKKLASCLFLGCNGQKIHNGRKKTQQLQLPSGIDL